MAVRYLRGKGLTYRELSEMTGFGEQNLRLRDKGYNEELRWQREEHPEGIRGRILQVTEAFIEFIVGAAREFLSQQRRRKRLKIRSFLSALVHKYGNVFFMQQSVQYMSQANVFS